MAEPVVMLSAARSGTTWIGRGLAMSPDVRWDSESFNPQWAGKEFTEAFGRWLDESREWSHSAVCIAKVLADWGPHERLDALVASGVRVLVVERRDGVAAARSLLRARKTNRWLWTMTGWLEPDVDEQAVEQIALRNSDWFTAARDAIPEDRRLVVTSEDLFGGGLGPVFDWLGVRHGLPVPRG